MKTKLYNIDVRQFLMVTGLLVSIASVRLPAADLRVTEVDAKRAATKKVPPEYTDAARQMKVSGKVELEVVISESGAVEDVKIVSGSPFLTRPCAKAVKQWVFTPFKDNGNPARAVAPLSFEFRQ